MTQDADDMAAERGRLAGETVHVVGRLHGLAASRLERLLAERGAKLAKRLSARVSLVALAHSTASVVENDGTLRFPFELPPRVELISEGELRRLLGLLPPREPSEQSLAVADLERVSALPSAVIACLVLFDVLDLAGGRYAYRDLLAARETKRLLDAGASLRGIIEADIELRRRGRSLPDARLTVSSSGQLFHSVGGALADLSGQFAMPFRGEAIDVDDTFQAAEAAEQDGDLAKAESLYATLMRIEQSDPVLPFNLGNVLREQGRTAEAKVAWQMAAARDPSFAEAWYNLALAAEDDGQEELAAEQYRRALRARPDYEEAHFNLALMLTRADRFAEAMPLWESLPGRRLTPAQVSTARRAAKLCAMQLAAEQSQAG